MILDLFTYILLLVVMLITVVVVLLIGGLAMYMMEVVRRAECAISRAEKRATARVVDKQKGDAIEPDARGEEERPHITTVFYKGASTASIDEAMAMAHAWQADQSPLRHRSARAYEPTDSVSTNDNGTTTG